MAKKQQASQASKGTQESPDRPTVQYGRVNVNSTVHWPFGTFPPRCRPGEAMRMDDPLLNTEPLSKLYGKDFCKRYKMHPRDDQRSKLTILSADEASGVSPAPSKHRHAHALYVEVGYNPANASVFNVDPAATGTTASEQGRPSAVTAPVGVDLANLDVPAVDGEGDDEMAGRGEDGTS